jgi:hypothetical protein
MPLFTFRHGHKFNTEYPSKWQKSRRCRENPFDPPLSSGGKENAQKLGREFVKLHKAKKINLLNTQYIYSSPMTRCITTSIEVIKIIKKELGHTLQIRLESKLLEGFKMEPVTKFSGGGISFSTPEYYTMNGKKYYSELDAKLSFNNLCNDYSRYIDAEYDRMTNPKDTPFETKDKAAMRIIRCVLNIAKKEKLAIISGHANTNYYCYSCFIGSDHNTDQFYNSQTATTKLVGYDLTGKSRLMYKPNNKFNAAGYN